MIEVGVDSTSASSVELVGNVDFTKLKAVSRVSKELPSLSHSAKFDQKSGTYTVELPAGSYRTMLVIALPAKKDGGGKLNAPSRPVKSEKVYELTKDQELNIEVP